MRTSRKNAARLIAFRDESCTGFDIYDSIAVFKLQIKVQSLMKIASQTGV